MLNCCACCGNQFDGYSINTDLPYNSAISLLGIHPKEMKTRIQTNTLHECNSIIPNNQKVETTQMSTN